MGLRKICHQPGKSDFCPRIIQQHQIGNCLHVVEFAFILADNLLIRDRKVFDVGDELLHFSPCLLFLVGRRQGMRHHPGPQPLCTLIQVRFTKPLNQLVLLKRIHQNLQVFSHCLLAAQSIGVLIRHHFKRSHGFPRTARRRIKLSNPIQCVIFIRRQRNQCGNGLFKRQHFRRLGRQRPPEHGCGAVFGNIQVFVPEERLDATSGIGNDRQLHIRKPDSPAHLVHLCL